MALKVALFGNPNCGKTTLYNKLTGSCQYVGNWPGVTVEKKEGFLKKDRNIKIVDLPGIYSLTPYTDEEIVSRNFLFYEKPDLILNVVAGDNLERSLYLTMQLLETKIPIVLVVSMMDRVEKGGGYVDLKLLSKKLNCKVIAVSPTSCDESFLNVQDLILEFNSNFSSFLKYSPKFEEYLEKIEVVLKKAGVESEKSRFFAIKFLENDEEIIKSLNLNPEVLSLVKNILNKAAASFEEKTRNFLINERYSKIDEVVLKSVSLKKSKKNISDKIDNILTNKFLAIPIFVFILGSVYYFCIGFLGRPMSNFMEEFLKNVVTPNFKIFLSNFKIAGWLESLILDGIFSGVGIVLTFVPQIFMLFLFLSILEDCGYMARVAFILDKILLKFGFCGKSVISFLVSSGCGVNGIMATKTIKDQRSRFSTILTTTFVPCNAKLPIITVICSYIFKKSFLTILLVYFLCILAILVVGLVLKKFSGYKSSRSNFVMELGPYILPNFKNTFLYTVSNVKYFVLKVGTIIFLASILIWFLLNVGVRGFSLAFVSQEDSLLAQIGKILTPIFKPAGFGRWQAVVATLSGIFAKENVVNTFGVILKSAQNFNDSFNLSYIFTGDFAALSFLIFNMLCAPCVAAIASIYKQTLSLKFTLKILFLQTLVAYISSFLVYRIGGLISKEVEFGIESLVAFLILAILVFLAVARFKNLKATKKEG